MCSHEHISLVKRISAPRDVQCRVYFLATGRSQPFDAREPSGRGLVAFVVAPFGDHFELPVLDASDLPTAESVRAQTSLAQAGDNGPSERPPRIAIRRYEGVHINNSGDPVGHTTGHHAGKAGRSLGSGYLRTVDSSSSCICLREGTKTN
jgi:hypothetical protein